MSQNYKILEDRCFGNNLIVNLESTAGLQKVQN